MINNSQRNYYSLVFSFLFLLVSIFILDFHELWLDEAYHYLLARDSPSIGELIHNGNSSGHPVLWNILLFFLKAVFPGIQAMQYFHCLIASICIYLILRFSPFSIFENLLLIFGYYFLYEYNVISKNYVLGFSLLFFSLVLLDQKKPIWLIGSVLALAANLHLFTLFVSVFLFVYSYQQRAGEEKPVNRMVALSIFVAGTLISIIQIIPSTEIIQLYRSYDSLSLLSFDRLGRSMSALNNGLLNIPDYRLHHFWNSNLLFNASHKLAYLASVLLAFLIFLSFRRSRSVLMLYFAPAFCIMAFVYIAPLATGVRYWGYFFMLLVICTWCFRMRSFSSVTGKYLFVVVAGLQLLVAIPALIKDHRWPFSNARSAAESLQARNLNRYPLFVHKLGLGPSLSAYCGKSIYYPSNKSYESYSYNIKHINYSANQFVKESLADLMIMREDTCVLVLGEQVYDFDLNSARISKISYHQNAISPSENYFLYLLTSTRQ